RRRWSIRTVRTRQAGADDLARAYGLYPQLAARVNRATGRCIATRVAKHCADVPRHVGESDSGADTDCLTFGKTACERVELDIVLGVNEKVFNCLDRIRR